MREWRRWAAVVLFAAAMAWLEAATVVYLRTLVGRLEPYQPQPLPLTDSLVRTEMVREAATLLMLAVVGVLAGRTARSRFGYWALAFGVWDILYYVFLAVIGPWPRSPLDWDILFLLPLPWWGPVLAPVSIAGLMVLGGTLVSQWDAPARPVWPKPASRALCLLGAGLALYIFMADALRAAGGTAAARAALPEQFPWPAYLVAWGLLGAPVPDLLLQVRRIRREGEDGAARPAARAGA